MKWKYLILPLFTCACIVSQAQVNVIKTIAGNDTPGYSGNNGPAINAEFWGPVKLFLDKNKNIYIADAYNNRIRRINSFNGIITTIAGIDTGAYLGDGVPATDAALSLPSDVVLDTSGNVYIDDEGNNRIRKIDGITGIITTIAGTGVAGFSGDNGTATNAKLDMPSGLCLDKFGNLFIAEYYSKRVRKINLTSGVITTIAGTGTSGYSGDGGPATIARLAGPIQVFTDTIGNIYVSDMDNSVVRKINAATGIISTIAGKDTAGYSGDGGPATNAELGQPSGIFIDSAQNIFIADWGNGTIRKIDAANSIITTLAGTGIKSFSGDGGPATNAQLSCTDIVFDNSDTMYIADYGANRIRKVFPYSCTGTPAVSFTYARATGSTGITDTFTYTGTPYLIDSIRWSFGDGGTDTVLNPVHTYAVNDTYRVCVTLYDYCGVDSVCSSVVSDLGINSLPAKGEPAIWPNPMKGDLTIEGGANSELSIYDMVGRSAMLTMTVKSDKEVVNVAQLPPGIYVVQIVSPSTGSRTTKKIVKQ